MRINYGVNHYSINSIILYKINVFTVKNPHSEKLLGVHFDDQLKFDFYIEKLCKIQIASYMRLQEWPLAWTCQRNES